jgi:hypothetical protein
MADSVTDITCIIKFSIMAGEEFMVILKFISHKSIMAALEGIMEIWSMVSE